MKLYLIYKVKEPSLPYAYTVQKQTVEGFLSQRNPSCFTVKAKKFLTETERTLYIQQNMQFIKQRYLIQIPYENEKGDIVDLWVTYEEDDKIVDAIERIQKDVEKIEKVLRKYPLCDKYENSIRRMIIDSDGQGNLLIDTLQLFIDIFKDTFFLEHTKEDDEFPTLDLEEF